jgi:hypothetical protein
MVIYLFYLDHNYILSLEKKYDTIGHYMGGAILHHFFKTLFRSILYNFFIL